MNVSASESDVGLQHSDPQLNSNAMNCFPPNYLRHSLPHRQLHGLGSDSRRHLGRWMHCVWGKKNGSSDSRQRRRWSMHERLGVAP